MNAPLRITAHPVRVVGPYTWLSSALVAGCTCGEARGLYLGLRHYVTCAVLPPLHHAAQPYRAPEPPRVVPAFWAGLEWHEVERREREDEAASYADDARAVDAEMRDEARTQEECGV